MKTDIEASNDSMQFLSPRLTASMGHQDVSALRFKITVNVLERLGRIHYVEIQRVDAIYKQRGNLKEMMQEKKATKQDERVVIDIV